MKRNSLLVFVISAVLMLSFCEKQAEVSPERFKVLADTVAQELEYDPWMELAYELASNYPEEYVAGMVMVQATERSIMEQDEKQFDKFFDLLKNYPETGALEMTDQIAIGNQIAWIMTNQGLLTNRSMEVIEFTVSKFKVNEVGLQWREELGAVIYDTQASIFEGANEPDKALEAYSLAIGYQEQPQILLKRGLLLEDKGDLAAALEDYVAALTQAPNQVMISSKVKEVYAELYPEQDVQVFYNDLLESLMERRKEEVLSEGFNIAAPEFEFTDFAGNTINASNMLGKVVLVDFWATWCSPCRRELPEFQKFYELYKNNPKVVFIAASTDSERDKVKPFITGLNFTFPVAFAGDNAGKFGVEGIPSLFIIGPSGKIRYKVVGYDPDKDFVREMGWRVESLLDS